MAEFDKEQEKQEETTLEIHEEQQVNPVEKTNTIFGWLDKTLKLIKKYSAKKIIEAMLFIVLAIFLGIFLYEPERVFKSYDDYQKALHNERQEQRQDNTPLIQAELNVFREQYNVSWAAVWELHNSTNNLDGLPFLFASLTYESMNPALHPIADEFDNVRLSLYPLSTYLRKNGIWCGDVEELKDIDISAYYKAKALGISYLGFKVLTYNNAPNALLSVAFVEGCEIPDMDALKQSCYTTSYKIGALLTVNKEEELNAVKKK